MIDIMYDERVWEFNPVTLKIRLQVIGITVLAFYLGSYGYRRIAHHFIHKSKDKKRASWKEYALIFLVNLILLNLIYLLPISYFANMGFRGREFLLVNVMVSLLLFVYYTVIRNRILFKNLMEQNLQLEKIKVDQLETELKFLKSQYHPHFLFNALNTIYFQIDEENEEAKQSIEELSSLLRYQLYNIEQEVTMEQEINYLKSYISFQQLRMSERLVLNTFFDPALKEQKIHPLLFQPLVENAFKYVRGEYKIQLEIKLSGKQIQAEIKNTISPSQNINNRKKEGIGIENLRRRLNLLYPNRHTIEIKPTENWFIVKLTICTD
ncbi:MAG: histidine kinase [Tannerellaceae bacterium]|nr:histidine kinase [Tannerellaceae bacterium]